MAILDLQTMKPKPVKPGVAPRNSGASKGCNNSSRLSLILC